ncbi:hypothetical protein Leryth_016477 [Lithospermum erythrorhizon]|nr:hypothetical protein Leryth_016477 [Lithospermum erythrorhizon]
MASYFCLGGKMEGFQGVVSTIEKIVHDSAQLSKGGSAHLTSKQMQQRVGLKPSVVDCLDGLNLIADMHRSEYKLKETVVSTLAELALKPSACGDLVSLQRLLVDQPNISMDEVQNLLEIIFAEEIC